jgi:hypothetical protein
LALLENEALTFKPFQPIYPLSRHWLPREQPALFFQKLQSADSALLPLLKVQDTPLAVVFTAASPIHSFPFHAGFCAIRPARVFKRSMA